MTNWVFFIKTEKYPILSRLLGSYFHQGWAEEFSNSDQAIEEIVKCETADSLRDSVKEIDHLLSLCLTENDCGEIMTSTIGCYFEPGAEKTNYSNWLSKIGIRFRSGQ